MLKRMFYMQLILLSVIYLFYDGDDGLVHRYEINYDENKVNEKEII